MSAAVLAAVASDSPAFAPRELQKLLGPFSPGNGFYQVPRKVALILAIPHLIIKKKVFAFASASARQAVA